MKKIIAATMIATVTATSAFAHGGGLNSNGCHNNNSTGTYHCHQNRNTSDEQITNMLGLAAGLFLLNAIISGSQQQQHTQQPQSQYAPTTTTQQGHACGTYVVTNRQRMGQVLMQRINTCSGAVMSQWWQKK